MRSYYSAQRINVKVMPVKKNKVLCALESLAGMALMSFFPIAIVYCFFGILCGNN